MNRIKILPEILSNKIAAGEVVERPSSVVKELVENAIDANSTKITVEIEKGGRDLIRISDNGTGMRRDDALLAIERYATSKIETDDDLFSIKTLGFRGEALPSIASVSRFTLATRDSASDTGTQIHIEGGKIKNVIEAGIPCGTMISVRQLFYNTPARRKFLKTINTEMGHIADTLSSIALGKPHIHFKLIHNRKTVRSWARVSDPEERITEILGQTTGNDFYPIRFTGKEPAELSISGWISSPAISRSSSQKIFIYVNGRHVKDRGVVQALLDGYRGRLMKGKYPVAAVLIEVKPELVDVNVHPAKSEVRFAIPGNIHRAIRESTSQTLLGSDRPLAKKPAKQEPIPSERFEYREVRVEVREEEIWGTKSSPIKAAPGQKDPDNNPSPTREEKKPAPVKLEQDPVFKSVKSPLPSEQQVKKTTPCSTQAASTQAASTQAASTQAASTQAASTQAASTQAASTQAASTQAASTQAASTQAASTQAASTQAASTQAASTQAASTQAASTGNTSIRDNLTEKNTGNVFAKPSVQKKTILPKEIPEIMQGEPKDDAIFFQTLIPIAQLHNTYIICQYDDGMILIDQHAAHERVVFEALKKRSDGSKKISQRLLIPETIDLDYREAAVLEGMVEELSTAGFDIAPFGGNTFAIEAVPAILSDREIKPVILEIIESTMQTGYQNDVEKAMEEALVLISCHGAIRAGQALSREQMKRLLVQLDSCDNPSYCPHGRPTWIRWDLKHLEKTFRRVA